MLHYEVGQKINNWEVIEQVARSMYRVRCSCGYEVVRAGHQISSSRSCQNCMSNRPDLVEAKARRQARTQLIIELHESGMTFQEIAELLRITRQRVNQLYHQGIE